MNRDPAWRSIGLIAVSEDEYTFTLGLAKSDQDGPALMVMCDVETPDAQELGLGMDTYCLVREDQAGTFYGGVESVCITEASLVLRLRHDAAQELGLPEKVIWDLEVTKLERALLLSGVHRVFRFGRPDEHPVLDVSSD